jgi:predicted P-loop ATPase
MDAGCQVDMAPILTGAQGLGKSSLLKTMLPSDQYYCSISFKQIDKEAAVIMQGKIIGEFAELKGFSTSAMEDIKDFITRRTEEWRKPYDRCTSTYKRRIVFAGTTNENEFLDDPTGNRRWLPISIGVMDLAWVKDNRDQLWAEGLVAWSENNCTPLWEDVTRLAKDVHQNYHTSDAWQEKIARWVFEDNLSGTPAVVGFSITDMAWQALGIETRNIDRKVEIRLKRIITRLKFEPKHVGGVVKWYYNENG